MQCVSFSLLMVSMLIISNFVVQSFKKLFMAFLKFFFKENVFLNAFHILKDFFLKKGLIRSISNIKLS